MGDDAAAKMKKPQLTGDLARLTEDSVTEILLRLPAKSVLRCRAVCKAWRDITSTPSFLSAHARLRPADVVLYAYLYVPVPHFVDVGLDAVPVSSSNDAGRRRLIRYPKTQDWLLLASADGALLFKKDEGVYALCNPTTRQWAQLPRLARSQQQDSRVRTDREYALYLDIPSGEYRLLCRRSLSTAGTWCILSTGGGAAAKAKPRHVDLDAAEAAGITELVPSLRTAKAPHVALGGRLHWPPQQTASVAGGQTEMVVFDMSLETFHLMAGPPTITGMFMKLFDMDGMLVAADFGKVKHVEFLEDYDNKRWGLRHRVATPWGSGYGRPLEPIGLLSVATAADRDGNIMLGNDSGLVVYNVRTRKVKTVDSVATRRNEVVVSRHVFKESLVQQPGFVAAAQSSIDLSLVHF